MPQHLRLQAPVRHAGVPKSESGHLRAAPGATCVSHNSSLERLRQCLVHYKMPPSFPCLVCSSPEPCWLAQRGCLLPLPLDGQCTVRHANSKQVSSR